MRTGSSASATSDAPRAAICSTVLLLLLIVPIASRAQDAEAAPPEPACAKQCAAAGFDDEYCDRACRVPVAQPLPPGQRINWDCATQCRASGGNMGDCIQTCKRN